MFTITAQTPPKPGPKPGVSAPTATEPQLAQAQTAEEPRPFMNRQPLVFDGKRMRKAVIRKTIDYNSCVVRYLENRKWFKNLSSKHAIQPDEAYAAEVLPPVCMTDNPMNAVTTKFVRTSTNKLRCPIFCVVWTPEGRRLVTGASSGEFTLWNGLTFNFETILTAHDSPVRSMVWNHSDSWLLSADHGGMVKYWQSNMNNVQMYEAHKEPIRGLRLATVAMATVRHQMALISLEVVASWGTLDCFIRLVLVLFVKLLLNFCVVFTWRDNQYLRKIEVLQVLGKHKWLE